MSVSGAWTYHLLTGEYPPHQGGVSDYSAQVASGLAAAGARVHVWTTPGGEPPEVAGVTVHREAGGWSSCDLRRLGTALDVFPAPRRLLVQHTPNAWGAKGLNFGFCQWLNDRRRHRGDEIRVMFHEVAYPWQLYDKPTRWVLAAGQRWMARTLLKAATHSDVTTPAWEELLRSVAAGRLGAVGWRPVPSNIPVLDDPGAVASVRTRVAPRGELIVGSFSTFSELTGPLLTAALPDVLGGRSHCVGLLVGQGGDRLAARMLAVHPGLRGRVVATGPLVTTDISAHLAACDVIVQLYPDGLTTRRTSLMAALAHGVPVVSNTGHLTEPFWAGSGAVAIAEVPGGVGAVVDRLLNEPRERSRLGSAGRDLYESRFALGRTVEAILGTAPLGVTS